MNNLDSLTREELLELAHRQQAELAELRGGAPSHEDEPDDDETDILPPLQNQRAVMAALLALVAAAAGEYILRTSDDPRLGVVLYGFAVILLAVTLPRFALRPPTKASPRRERLVRALLLVGGSIAIALEVVTFLLLRDNLGHPLAPWLWLSGMLVLLATGVLVWRYEAISARWADGVPRDRRGRIWLGIAVALILIAAVAARYVWLDRIPLGINPDEGDRSATAMQLLRGTTDRGIFDSGWYRISMMYFYLLAGAFKVLGIGYVQARAFTALFGVGAALGVTWIGVRHFGLRVGVIAGFVMATTGLALQYSRVTGEASQTVFLWVLSLALFLEGARSGRSLAWIGAGLAGGFSFYFYPTGRMWAPLAAMAGIYLLARWWAARQGGMEPLVRGLTLAAVASLAILAPFAAQYMRFPHEFALRYQETSALTPEGVMKLHHYLETDWGPGRILVAQLGRTMGVFSRYSDGSGFWPMHEPVLNPAFALLALLGLGTCLLRLRDPRAFILALWFCIGTVGVIVTVETPNVLRYAVAVPALALFVGVLLDDLVRRVSVLRSEEAAQRPLRVVATVGAAVLVAGALFAEVRFYFIDYAKMSLWTGWNQEGRALTDLPEGTLSTSLGNSFHMINSGWVRLLAHDAARGGIKSPGSDLPLPEEGLRGLSFSVYPNQEAYLPWLQTVYPGAQPVDYTRAGEGLYFTLLYVPPEEVARGRGAVLSWEGGSQNVTRLGEPPQETPPEPAPARWTSTLRVPRQGNYSLQLGPGPARLFVDGRLLLDVPAGKEASSTAVQLARGDHGVVLEATTAGTDVWWGPMRPNEDPVHTMPGLTDLRISDGVTHGLAARVSIEGLPEQFRQDNTLATCCLGDLLGTRDKPVLAQWRANLEAPESGTYGFRLTAPGMAALTLNGEPVIRIDEAQGGTLEATVYLEQGPHALDVRVDSTDGARGVLELAWSPPAGVWSIIPEDALTPPRGALVLEPMPDEIALTPDAFPVDKPLETVE